VRGLLAGSVVAATAVAVQSVGVAPASAVQAAQDRVVSSTASTLSPQINDGSTQAITQVGNLIVSGGTFTSVTQAGNGQTPVARTNLVAFDATTGAIVPGFAPVLDGAVLTLLPGPTPTTVYVGGAFATVNNVAQKGIALLDLSTGLNVSTFKPAYENGLVQDLAMTQGHLVMGGTFTKIGQKLRGGLASLNPTTGATDDWMQVNLTGHHNYNGVSGAKAGVGATGLDVTPDGTRMVVIGNFKQADGVTHDQIAMLDLTGTTTAVRADWNTSGYASPCNTNAFDSYVRDVELSPDGTYFVVVATGGPSTGTLCDTAARWSTYAVGTSLTQTWVNETGGDTLFSVAVTGSAVYVGGHERWMNNPTGRDKAQAGAVPRPGLAALDPNTGVPFSWNPGRNPRGVGTTELFATPTGLWAGYDTDYIGNFQYLHRRVAFFPLAGAPALPTAAAWTLPSDLYQAGAVVGGSDGIQRRIFNGAGVDYTWTKTSGLSWLTSVRGGFMVDGTFYYGYSDGALYKRTFDGTTFGDPVLVDPYNDPFWSTIDTGSGQTYRGVRPSLYGTEMTTISGLFYDNHRIYYTLTNTSALYTRTFNPESGIVGATRTQVPGVSMNTKLKGMFLAGGFLYTTDQNGKLTRQTWLSQPLTYGTIQSGTAVTLTDPSLSTTDFRGNALFVGPGPAAPANQPPVASVTVSCSGLSCGFDGSASSDPDGTIQSAAWTFGDGGTATGLSASHNFAASGTYTVTLTLTDNRGGIGTWTKDVTVTLGGNTAPTAAISSASCADLVCSFASVGSFDPDGSIQSYSWDFGDTTSAATASASHTYAAGGTVTVTLTVTDNLGATGTATVQVTPVPPPATIAFVGVGSSNGTFQNASVKVPSGVLAGDGLLLYATVNSTTPTITDPAGWTPVATQVSGTMVTKLWQRVAVGGDGDSSVPVTLSGFAKVDLQLVAYRGTAASGPVDVWGSSADASVAAHTTPTMVVAHRNSWLLSYWGDKGNTTTAWTLPGSVTTRDVELGTGSGFVTSALADSAGADPVGTSVGGLQASTNAASSRGVVFSVLLRAAGS
jgi:PKD repeat protein